MRTVSEQVPKVGNGIGGRIANRVGARRTSNLEGIKIDSSNLALLPDQHNTKDVKRERDNNATECKLCFAPFTQKLSLRLGSRNPMRHCKKCGKPVCEVCSQSKRQLAKADPQQYRVCDKCDFEMDNLMHLTPNLEEVREAQRNKITLLNSHVMQMHDSKEILE